MKFWVQVKPHAKHEKVEKLPDGTYRVSVHAPAHEGLANTALMTLLAKHFHVPKAHVTILMGQKGRKKLIQIV